MEMLAATAALAVAGSPSLWAMSMADMGATRTGIDSFLPATQPRYTSQRLAILTLQAVAAWFLIENSRHGKCEECDN